MRSEGHEYLQKKSRLQCLFREHDNPDQKCTLYGTSRAVHQEHNDKERGKMSYTATTSCTEKMCKSGLFIVDEVAIQ